MASILIICGMSYISLNYKLDEFTYVLFAVGALLLMYSNIVVFLVHEDVLKTQYENTVLKLQKQKSEIDTDITLFCKINTENSNILFTI